MTNRGVIAVAGVALFLSGCSTTGSSDDSTGAESSSAESTSETIASPVSQFLGLGDFSNLGSADSQARIVEMQRNYHELTVACMAAEGFDYVAPILDESVMFAGETADGLTYGSPAYTARYGFGVTTEYWSQASVGPELVGYDDSNDVAADVDPNQAYVEGLSDADRAAYDTALYGNSVDYEWDPSLTNTENQSNADAFYADYEPSGCLAEAESEAEGAESFAKAADFYDEFSDELDALYASVDDDQRITDKLSDVEQCVVDQGLEYVDPTDPYSRWEAALADIGQNNTTTDDSEGPSTVVIDDEGKALLADLQAEEIAIATATDECGGGQEDLLPLYDRVTAEYEQRFLDDNADRVAAYAAGDS